MSVIKTPTPRNDCKRHSIISKQESELLKQIHAAAEEDARQERYRKAEEKRILKQETKQKQLVATEKRGKSKQQACCDCTIF